MTAMEKCFVAHVERQSFDSPEAVLDKLHLTQYGRNAALALPTFAPVADLNPSDHAARKCMALLVNHYSNFNFAGKPTSKPLSVE
eukprot:5216103-Amphidinium_carterae.1